MPSLSLLTPSLLALLLFGAAAQAAEPLLRISRWDRPSLVFDISQEVVSTALQAAGIGHEFVPMPLLRSLPTVNAGELDAELQRIEGIEALYPNLLRVPTAVNRIKLAMYGTDASINSASRAALMKLRIGLVKGVLVTAKHVKADESLMGGSTQATLAMLVRQRFDLALLVHIDAEIEITRLKLSGIHVWPQYWAEEPVYLYLHSRHKELLPRIDQALRQMEGNGSIERIYNDAIKRATIAPLLRAQGFDRGPLTAERRAQTSRSSS